MAKDSAKDRVKKVEKKSKQAKDLASGRPPLGTGMAEGAAKSMEKRKKERQNLMKELFGG